MLGWLFDRDYFKRESEEYIRRNSKRKEPIKVEEPREVSVKIIEDTQQNPYKTFADTFTGISKRYELYFQSKVEDVKRSNKRYPKLTEPEPLPKREDNTDLRTLDNAPRVKKVLSSSSYLSENNTFVEVDTQYHLNITEYEIRPPVLRIVEDIDHDFCSWTMVWVDELIKTYSAKELSKKAYRSIGFNALRKDVIEVKWKRTGTMECSYVIKQINVNNVTIEINTKEMLLVETVTRNHRDNINKEIREENDNKDALARLALDEVVKSILNK